MSFSRNLGLGKRAHEAWDAFLSGLYKHLRYTVIVAVFAFVITFGFTEADWEHMLHWVRVLISLGVTVIAEIFFAMFLSLRDRAEAHKNDEDELRRFTVESEQLRTDNEKIETALQHFGKYFGLDKRDKMLAILSGSSDPDNLFQALDKRHFNQQQCFLSLLSSASTTATYKDQHEYADILASSAQERLWTTCVDCPSDFQVRNYDYMASLANVPARLHRGPDNDPPSTCRIFVGQPEDLFDDARQNYDKWIDLYKWHLKWGQNANDKVVRFLPINNNDYHELFHSPAIEVDAADIIHDFMIVDNRLVYGREIAVGREVIHLHLIKREVVVQKYDRLYKRLWARSKTVHQMIESFLGKHGDSQDLLDLKAQCYKAESKLHITSDYGDAFTEADYEGIPFFNRVCELIGKSGKLCFAVDRAAKKEGALWDSWDESPYKEFREASMAAAHLRNTEFNRVFVLEKKFPRSDREKVWAFIKRFVANKIRVGFILREDMELGEIAERYDTDFIVVGYEEDPVNGQQLTALGFELQDDDFKAAELSIESNLIAKQRLAEHYSVFSKLWSSPKIVTVYEARDGEINAAVERLLEEEKR